jgi:hypothetical protein
MPKDIGEMDEEEESEFKNKLELTDYGDEMD